MKTFKRLLWIALIVVALLLASFPQARSNVVVLAQNPTRLRALLIDHNLDVSGNQTVAGTLTVAGATTLSNIDLDGNTLTVDSDGDTTLASVSDDTPILTLGTAAGVFNVATGNLKVGNGTPSTSQDGEDAYVEGGFEVDGTSRFDGAIDANGAVDIAGNLTSATGAITVADTLSVSDAATFDTSITVGSGGDAISEAAFGTSTNVVSGTTIAHGMSSTPTLALLTPQSTGGYTATAYILATDATSITIGVQDGVTIPTLNWMTLR